MRLEQVYLRDIGPFDELKLKLEPGTDPKRADVYLLTGPNGCGKSTILFAIARALAVNYFMSIEADKLTGDYSIFKKMWSKNSVFGVSAGIHGAVAISCAKSDDFKSCFGGNLVNKDMFFLRDKYLYCQNMGRGALEIYVDKTNSQERFSWSAFAYAGMRSVVDVNLTSIQELSDSPFSSSLSFVNTSNAKNFATWIANQEFKSLKARKFGKIEKSEQLMQSIRDIENTITKIIERSFKFVTSENDSNVRVELDGTLIDLGLLPDGLKSIVSWVADLLMRLDRIPWENDTPVLQRSFLLLLDEIDIHLHPEWQRKVLPIVQEMFPNAQIIASTHSPFVVASVSDAQIIPLALDKGKATLLEVQGSQLGVSYSSILKSIFGISSEFDLETEADFKRFREAKHRALQGDASAEADMRQVFEILKNRSEETATLITYEWRQYQRQLEQKGQS